MLQKIGPIPMKITWTFILFWIGNSWKLQFKTKPRNEISPCSPSQKSFSIPQNKHNS